MAAALGHYSQKTINMSLIVDIPVRINSSFSLCLLPYYLKSALFRTFIESFDKSRASKSWSGGLVYFLVFPTLYAFQKIGFICYKRGIS